MIDHPLVSIITPSFNQAQFLEQTIVSVLGQDYPNIEYIVMDGGSTDGSVEIIRRHEERIASWTSERDNGQTDAIRRGFERATGEVLAWLNSDDLLAPSAVRMAVDALRRFPDAGMIYGDRLHIDAKGNVIGINRMPAFYPSIFRRNITLPQETVFFRRDAYDKAGGLDESLAFSMDFDLWVRLAKVAGTGGVRHVPAFLGSYREHAASKSVTPRKFMDEHERVYAKHFNGRRLPAGIAAKWNRIQHKARVAIQRTACHDYRREVVHIRELCEREAKATASAPALT
jgi:glycosyltransferase involved in cell wall biosynthesis